MIPPNPLILELLDQAPGADVVMDNARSHAIRKIPIVRVPSSPISPSSPHATSPTCRWQSTPPPTLKRSSSAPIVGSLHSLVAPTQRRSLEYPARQSSPPPLSPNPETDPPRPRRMASELLAEYLRISTQDLVLLDGEEEEEEEETPSMSSMLEALPQTEACSLTTNVKKPVRRQSLDSSSSI